MNTYYVNTFHKLLLLNINKTLDDFAVICIIFTYMTVGSARLQTMTMSTKTQGLKIINAQMLVVVVVVRTRVC